MCVWRRHKYAQSDLGFRFQHEETLHPLLFIFFPLRLRLDYRNAQADLNLCWAYMSDVDVVAQMYHYENTTIQIYRKFHLQNLKNLR